MTDTNNNDGVRKALEKFFEIGAGPLDNLVKTGQVDELNRIGYLQFVENTGLMRSDRRFMQAERIGDLGYRTSLQHLQNHFEFPVGKLFEGIVFFLSVSSPERISARLSLI